MSSFSTNKRQLLMCLHLSTSKWQLIICLHPLTNKWPFIMRLYPVMNKRQLTSVCSLEIHHVLAFFVFCGFFLSTKHSHKFASPLMHTWLIESEVLPCPYHLVIIERKEKRRPLPPPPPPFCNSFLLLLSLDGQKVALPSP